MTRRLAASFTVEAAMIMAIVLWALLTAIQSAYRLRDETVGAMAAQFTVEILRHDEEKDETEADRLGKLAAGNAFSWKEYNLETEYAENILTGGKVSVDMKGGSWNIAISQKVFDPENFLRKLSLAEQE